MHLSLRTLLAFEDNIFDIEQRRHLERTLPVNEAAVGVLGRIRNAMRHPYLGVPGKVQGQEELDANLAAEYLDQQMPQEQVEKFENFCFSDDKYLAEVASAHQIISNVLGEPARISRDCRYRCYQLLLSVPPESKKQNSEQNTETAPQEYRKTMPQDFYTPPQTLPQTLPQSAPQASPQVRKTDIISGEIIDEPAISMSIWRPDKKAGALKADAVRPAESKIAEEKQPERASVKRAGKPEEAAAKKNLMLVVLTAAVIILSMLCFKLYKDGKSKEQNRTEGISRRTENLSSSAGEEEKVNLQIADASAADVPAADLSDTSLPPLIEEPPKPEVQISKILPPEVPPAQDPFLAAVNNAAVNNNTAADNTATDNGQYRDEEFGHLMKKNAADEVPEPEIKSETKPVYHFTEQKPFVNERGEFASVQPVISFLPPVHQRVPQNPQQTKLPDNIVSASNSPQSKAESKAGDAAGLRLQYQPNNYKREKPPEKQTASVPLPQMPPAIIQAGGIQAENKQTGNDNTGGGAAVPQRNVVLGRTVESGENALLFTAKSADASWQIETGKIDLAAEQYLLTSSPFRCTFELNGRHHSRLLNGFEIEMLGDSKLCIMPLDENGNPGIYLDYGRIIIRLKNTAGKNTAVQNPPEELQKEFPQKEFSLRIQTEKTEGIISLTGPKSIVFIDTFAEVIEQRISAEENVQHPRNAELPPKPTPIIGLLPDPLETVSWKVNNIKDKKTGTFSEAFIAARDTSFLLDGISNARGLIQHHPNWIRPVSPPSEAAEIAAVCRRLYEEKNGNCEAVLQSLIKEDSVPVRSFGLRLWGDLGCFDVPLTVLSDTKENAKDGTAKDKENVIPVNRILTSYFREVMKRDEESIQRLSESIRQLKH